MSALTCAAMRRGKIVHEGESDALLADPVMAQ